MDLTHCLGGLEIALIGRAGKQLRPMGRLLGSNPVHRLPGTEQLARFWRGCDLGVEILQRAFAMALDRFLDCGIDRVIVGIQAVKGNAPGKIILVIALGVHVRSGPCYRWSSESTSELQSLMRISYAVFCLKKKNKCE